MHFNIWKRSAGVDVFNVERRAMALNYNCPNVNTRAHLMRLKETILIQSFKKPGKKASHILRS